MAICQFTIARWIPYMHDTVPYVSRRQHKKLLNFPTGIGNRIRIETLPGALSHCFYYWQTDKLTNTASVSRLDNNLSRWRRNSCCCCCWAPRSRDVYIYRWQRRINWRDD